MSHALRPRSNDAWLAALAGGSSRDEAAVAELHEFLRRTLLKLVGRRLGADDIADLVQESLARILANLERFRGDSAFSTWAMGVATRTAFTELRRRRARAARYDPYAEAEQDAARLAADTPEPEDDLTRRDVLSDLRRAIGTELTDRQRTVILAELRGVPTVEIAERMNTNRNALYKLTHDARVRLRRALLDGGHTADALGAPLAGPTS